MSAKLHFQRTEPGCWFVWAGDAELGWVYEADGPADAHAGVHPPPPGYPWLAMLVESQSVEFGGHRTRVDAARFLLRLRSRRS